MAGTVDTEFYEQGRDARYFGCPADSVALRSLLRATPAI
jgi:hypothetical protein